MGKSKGGKPMNVSEFSDKVTRKEGLKKSMTVAQIKEVLKVANEMLLGELYKLIRKL